MTTPDQSSSRSLLEAITRLLQSGAVGALVTVTSGDQAGAKLLVEQNGSGIGTLKDERLRSLIFDYVPKFLSSREDVRLLHVNEMSDEVELDSSLSLLFERLHPVPKLVICGAGHVGAALARLAVFVGYDTTVIDDRTEFLDPQRFPGQQISLVATDDWTSTTSEAIGDGRNVAVAIVTRGHQQDEECLYAVVRVNPVYIGLIGSKRRTNIVIDNLRKAGVEEETLRRIRAPIGLDIGAITPEEVALAIIAEIVAERHGAGGGSLSVGDAKASKGQLKRIRPFVRMRHD